MDEFLKEINTMIFRQWLPHQKSDLFNIRENEESVIFETELGEANITFHEMCIIELALTNKKTGNVDFYLHFQMKTIKHTIELYQEMMKSLLSLSENKALRILLSCTSGLTTGFFAEQLTNSAELLNLEFTFNAVPYVELFEKAYDYDAILLAPQISFSTAKVKEVFPDKIIIPIPSAIFAKYDTASCLNLIVETMKLRKEEEKAKIIEFNRQLKAEKKVLAISINNNHAYFYRVYHKNEILLDQMILKDASTSITLSDITDMIDVALARHKDIEIIGISMPGVIHDGLVTLSRQGFSQTPVASYIEKWYKIKTVILNNANATALGYLETQDEYNTFALFFQSRPITAGGVGVVINGQLIEGKTNIAGELQFLPFNSYPKFKSIRSTQDGCVEAMAMSLACLIAVINPDCIPYYTPLIIDEDDLVERIKKFVPENYIPKLIRLDNVKEYALIGLTSYCIKMLLDN